MFRLLMEKKLKKRSVGEGAGGGKDVARRREGVRSRISAGKGGTMET